jgi:TolA-binding protein
VSATLRMSRGALRIEVVPGRSQPFRVITERYHVEVLGTVFEVRDAEVSVEHGRVRVTRVGGDASSRVLAAGERWNLDDETSSLGIAPEPSAGHSPSADASAPARRVDGVMARPSVDPRALYARARKHLAAGEPTQARRLVEQALAGAPSAAQQAEGQTLLAECSLVAGDSKDAARRYAEVAKKHGNLPAGETALFAAGRTAHGAGQNADARRLFNQYLARYPSGQFANEARSRLAQLGQ